MLSLLWNTKEGPNYGNCLGFLRLWIWPCWCIYRLAIKNRRNLINNPSKTLKFIPRFDGTMTNKLITGSVLFQKLFVLTSKLSTPTMAPQPWFWSNIFRVMTFSRPTALLYPWTRIISFAHPTKVRPRPKLPSPLFLAYNIAFQETLTVDVTWIFQGIKTWHRGRRDEKLAIAYKPREKNIIIRIVGVIFRNGINLSGRIVFFKDVSKTYAKSCKQTVQKLIDVLDERVDVKFSYSKRISVRNLDSKIELGGVRRNRQGI